MRPPGCVGEAMRRALRKRLVGQERGLAHLGAAALALGAVFLTASCDQALEPRPVATAPVASTAPMPRPPRMAEPPARISDDRIAQYFATLEAQRLANGMLRQDRSPRDLPINARDVEEAFVRIALYDEYTMLDGQLVERKTPSVLRRWDMPVRMQLHFGEAAAAEARRNDTNFVTGYAARLASLTGHPVARVESGGNFHILVVDEAERQAIGPRLRQILPGVDSLTLDLVENLPLSVSCLVLAYSRQGGNVYTDALAIIRTELPDLSRRACFYEELAQGMGLSNDSPRARPSLFNDTAEFAVLTVLDEQLLRILYDPRLRPGMREAEARPIIREIASELMGGAS
ncbi:MAG: DUF2927 domain-containing protein [Rhodobacteraceae bacterium]|nr:MAG: DUF2927 domain-containing protein [Paracoccaceae bacterium]